MEKTETQYKQLGAEERATIMLMQQASKGLREIGRFLNRSPSTISREINRDLGHESGYVASLAGEQALRQPFRTLFNNGVHTSLPLRQ